MSLFNTKKCERRWYWTGFIDARLLETTRVRWFTASVGRRRNVCWAPGEGARAGRPRWWIATWARWVPRWAALSSSAAARSLWPKAWPSPRSRGCGSSPFPGSCGPLCCSVRASSCTRPCSCPRTCCCRNSTSGGGCGDGPWDASYCRCWTRATSGTRPPGRC